ncbi:hypothetical protein BCR35DRAFT_330761 [Leucosporidium creatinivorum]|uniref:Uncharacterized protein n=1 Tax=Leucosporidium creatinivorum TaxID=106004 RepID=A0A1Y2FSB0_9BASI|nr:hypothetical protein BCR35DRAFT_330761 [Leucosporidium creatinivorum]
MCRSSVTLFYGLWVKSWSLAFAADAYDKIHPTLLGIDLIARRWREGKLATEEQETKTTARELPGEVWELEKQEVIDEAVDQEALQALRAHCCWRCHCALMLSPEALKQDPDLLAEEGTPRSSWDDPSCPKCFEQMVNGVCAFKWLTQWSRDGETGVKTATGEHADSLLASFGLCLARNTVHKEDPEALLDFDELSPVALRLHAACALAPEALLLPANIYLRFRRLIRTYRLRVVDPTKSNITTLSNESLDTSQTASDRRTTAEPEESFAEAEPRWMLWSRIGRC